MPIWLFFPPASLMFYAYHARPFIYWVKPSLTLITTDFAYQAQPFISYYKYPS